MKLSISVYPPTQSVAYGLAQGTALADGDLVTLLDTESWRHVCGEVLVALLVTVVLGDVVEVLAADDQSTVHLCGNDGAGQDTATDGDEAGEGALLVCENMSAAIVHHVMSSQGFPQQSYPPLPSIQYQSSKIECPHTDVATLNGSLGRPESETDILVVTTASVLPLDLSTLALCVGEDVRLLLVSALALDSQFGGHLVGCGRWC